MQHLVVVERLSNWPLKVPDVHVVEAKSYIGQTEFTEGRGFRVVNLCRSYRYQSVGYYVSLLAEARGHRPFPRVNTIQDMKSVTLVRYASEDLERLIQRSLAPLRSRRFVLSIYFGKNVAARYDRLCSQLFSLFHAPLLQAVFVRGDKWQLQSVRPMDIGDVPESHRPFLVEATAAYLSKRPRRERRDDRAPYNMAILYNPDDPSSPSDDRAIRHFAHAAEELDFDVEIIDKDDYGRLAEFDALFIRETTSVNHHTYRFARRAAAEGLVVIDDPDSILRCTNKVYLAELMNRYKIPTPKTLILSEDNIGAAPELLGLPCILKQPDSSFSQGVVKASTPDELREKAEKLLERSEFIIAQEFLPTPFDWRVGVLDGKPLYACKYHMAAGHWQIVKHRDSGRIGYGRVETIPVDDAPARVVRTALKAAALIGNGLYGVDLKEVGRRVVVIEVNDNPTIEHGEEDGVLKGHLYVRIMHYFLQAIERRKSSPGRTE
ncbi:MAG: RimK family protein [Deltaproteobacteria bacterium]|nr:RimK family protein [Deltaproteobacteria bacterium]